VEKEMVLVAGVHKSIFVVAASASSGIKSISDLMRSAKQNPGKLSYASLGKGSLGHFSGELFSAGAGAAMLHVPFRDLGALSSAVGGGDVDLVFLPIAAIDAVIKSGRATTLASISTKRQLLQPNLMTVKEAGGPEMFDLAGWSALAVPKDTPIAIIEKLQADVVKVVASDAFRTKMAALYNRRVEPCGCCRSGPAQAACQSPRHAT